MWRGRPRPRRLSMLSGSFLYLASLLLIAWLVFLCRTLWRLALASSSRTEPDMRMYLTLAGIGCSTVAVGALLALLLSWFSVEISQYLGVKAIRIFSLLIFWPTLGGLLLCVGGRGRIRFLGIATCLVTGVCLFTLSMGTAIAVGAAPIVRHPTKYLIPEGYVGWVSIKHGENADPLQLSSGKYISRIPANGVLFTSSLMEDGWARDEYFYYSPNGSLRELRNTSWGEGGMIWAGANEWELSQDGSKPRKFTENFYVGTEDQYHRKEGHPKPQALDSTLRRRP
jgi:hypothetical protein